MGGEANHMDRERAWTPDDVQKMLMNPMYCLSEPPVVSEAQWIQAGVRLIGEMGPENYLRALLDILKAH
jgi:hypothetical protein